MYFRVSVVGRKLMTVDCSYLLNQLNGYLASWKNRALSYERIERYTSQFGKYWETSILVQRHAFPTEVLKYTRKIIYKFIWGWHQRGMDWKKMVLPKEEAGGLRLRDPCFLAKITMLKWVYRIWTNGSRSIWIKWMRSRHRMQKIEIFLKYRRWSGTPIYGAWFLETTISLLHLCQVKPTTHWLGWIIAIYQPNFMFFYNLARPVTKSQRLIHMWMEYVFVYAQKWWSAYGSSVETSWTTSVDCGDGE